MQPSTTTESSKLARRKRRKPLRKYSSNLLLGSCILILYSCARVPDVPLCKEITPDKGFCSWTLSQGGFYVDESRPYAFDPKKPDKLWTWWEIRPVMIQIPPHSWAEIKKFIIKSCRNSKDCPDDVGEWMDNMKVKQ